MGLVWSKTCLLMVSMFYFRVLIKFRIFQRYSEEYFDIFRFYFVSDCARKVLQYFVQRLIA